MSNPKSGLVIELDDFYNVADINQVWEDISKSHGINLAEPVPMTNDMVRGDTTGVIR